MRCVLCVLCLIAGCCCRTFGKVLVCWCCVLVVGCSLMRVSWYALCVAYAMLVCCVVSRLVCCLRAVVVSRLCVSCAACCIV